MATANCTLVWFLCNTTVMTPTIAIQRNATVEDHRDAVIYVCVVLVFYATAIMVLIGLNMERKRKDYWAYVDYYDEYMQSTYIDRLRQKLLEDKLNWLNQNAATMMAVKAKADAKTTETTETTESTVTTETKTAETQV